MRFKATIQVAQPPIPHGSNGYNRLHCTVCGKEYGTEGIIRATIPSWHFERTLDDGWFEIASQEATCREILYGRLTEMSWFVTVIRSLKLHDAWYASTSKTNELHKATQAIQDVVNGIWLGLTPSTNTFAYEHNRSIVNIPFEFLDHEVQAGGPMFSLCGWFLKNGMDVINHYQTNPRIMPTILTTDKVIEMLSPLRDLLATTVESDPKLLTQDVRTELLRQVCEFLWDGLNYKIQGDTDYHNWVKYMLVFHALGGLPGLSPELGLSYYGFPELEVYQSYDQKKTPKTNTKTPKLLCGHEHAHGGTRSTTFNGVNSFWGHYFARKADGRAVRRFLDGGIGLLKTSALKYLRFVPWTE